ncbi:Alpha/Beta hydrolase protein [Nemania abortiva]|nr:Alpha/Beta hydrolase protein [Nemania abortiva]
MTIEDHHGLEVVYDGPEAKLDIVAVHGLNGHREKTWTATNGVHWLRDLLPRDIPDIRVLTWSYDAATHSPDRASCQCLYSQGLELVADLTRARTLTQSIERPIIFVAHCLGGLVVKSALIHSDAARYGVLRDRRLVITSTYGVLYMGTPHRGSDGMSLGRLLANIASIFTPVDDRIPQHLERDSEWLQQQLNQYNPVSNKFATRFAYERYETTVLLGYKTLVVPRAPAIIPSQEDVESIAIFADHISMTKFSENTDKGYVKISEALQIMAMNAKKAIQSHWAVGARVHNERETDGKKSELPRSRLHPEKKDSSL